MRETDKWEKAKRAVIDAKRWNDLPSGKKYDGAAFEISLTHCEFPILVRAGQQVCGGHNYWETDKAFGVAILEYLLTDWDGHFNKIIKIMERKECEELKKCQSYVDELQRLINNAA